MNLKEKILYELKDSPKSLEELQQSTGKGKKNVQGRLSDLRKDGYAIELKPVQVFKYSLVGMDKTRIIHDHIHHHNLFNVALSISKLARELNITEDEAKLAIAKLFKEHTILQLDPDTIKFLS